MTSAPIMAVEDLAAGLAAEARLLGLDLGTKTINGIVEQMGVGGLVIGLPINLDGSEGPRAQSTRAFARNLGHHVAVPIAFWDERLSTAAVERHLIEAGASRKRRAEVVDRMAAAYILQGALDRLKHASE
jgi:putative Holliday junction resolvase